MKIYFLVPEDELPQDQFDRKALDIEALLRRLGVTRKLTGFQYVCYMVNQVVEDPSRLSLITKRLYPETARHFHTTRDSIELATRNVIRAVWGQADHRLLDHIAGIHLEKRPSNCEFIDILSSFLSRPNKVVAIFIRYRNGHFGFPSPCSVPNSSPAKWSHSLKHPRVMRPTASFLQF